MKSMGKLWTVSATITTVVRIAAEEWESHPAMCVICYAAEPTRYDEDFV